MSKRAINVDEGDMAVSGTSATAGATKRTERFDLHQGATVQHNISSGSYLLQASNDDNTWFDVGGGALTGDGMITLDANYRYLRVFTTTAGDGEFILFAHELLY